MEFTKGELCSAKVCDASGFSHYPCSRKAKVERNGKLYCTIHDPEYIKAKDKKNADKWEREQLERNKVYDREDAKNKACARLTTRELQALNPNLLKAAPALYEALEKISEGKGRFDFDRLVHASNTIEDMKDVAKEALALARRE